jgi:hypothetical protein
LEAIGKDSIPILKMGLKSPLRECRFHSAMALAYMEDSEAIPVLAECAKEERAFRVFALAGLSTLDDAQAHISLRELMSESSAETRYGAFRALWTLDRNDPFIRGADMGLEPDDAETGKKSNRGLWTLHVLQTTGEPMAHCTFRTRQEVVLFGAEQELTTPLVLSAGQRIMLTAQAGAETVSITKFAPNQPDVRREVPLKLADVLLVVDELGATYPDVVQLLTQASKQHNLAGRLETDSLPESGRAYVRPATDKTPSRKAIIGKEHQAPNIFPRFDDDTPKSSSKDDLQAKDETKKTGADGMASVPDEKKSSTDKKAEADEKSRGFWPRWNPFKKDGKE